MRTACASAFDEAARVGDAGAWGAHAAALMIIPSTTIIAGVRACVVSVSVIVSELTSFVRGAESSNGAGAIHAIACAENRVCRPPGSLAEPMQ